MIILNGIRELREESGLTQGQLAIALGVSRQSINAIERGRSVPGLDLAFRLSALFECPIDEMFWLETTENKTER
jgi:putative transcriptional regulator